MKSGIKFLLTVLVLFLLSPKTINSQVEKRVIGDCNRTTSNLFSGIDNIVFVKPEGAVYDLELLYNEWIQAKYTMWEENLEDKFFGLSAQDIFTMTALRLYFQLKEKFFVTTIFKSQIPDKLDFNTLYVDLEKTKVKIGENNNRELWWNYSYAFFDYTKKYFYNSGQLGTFTKRRGQWWIEDTYVGERVINTKFGDVLVNAINNRSDACQGMTRNYIGDEEIDNINFREAEKSFIKYWEKNYKNDNVEGIYKQTNYYSYARQAPNEGVLTGDLYRIVVLLDKSNEFYNVYYLHNNKLDFKIADLIAKIYKTNERNNYEFEYTDNFLSKANTSKVYKIDRLEFGSYKEPSNRGYQQSISTTQYNYYDRGGTVNGYGGSYSERSQSESSSLIAQNSDGFFIKYDEFDCICKKSNSWIFDAYFTRSFKPKRIYGENQKSNLKKSTRKTTPKKKSAPPDAKIID